MMRTTKLENAMKNIVSHFRRLKTPTTLKAATGHNVVLVNQDTIIVHLTAETLRALADDPLSAWVFQPDGVAKIVVKCELPD